MFNWTKKKKKSGGFIYGAYSGQILPPMIGINCPGKKWVVMLTRKNGFAITDGILVYGGEPRVYLGQEKHELIGQVKQYLLEELRSFCGEFSAYQFEEFINKDPNSFKDDLDIQFEGFLDACVRRIQMNPGNRDIEAKIEHSRHRRRR